MFKKCLPFFLLLIFLANVVGFGLVSLLQIKIHHSESRKDEKEKIVHLKISLAEIKSPESAFHFLEEDEFVFNGRRYDVISFRLDRDQLVLCCYDDTEEEESLFARLKEYSSPGENNLPGKDKNNFPKKGIEYDHTFFSFALTSFVSSAEGLTHVALFAPVAFRAVASPPPWLV